MLAALRIGTNETSVRVAIKFHLSILLQFLPTTQRLQQDRQLFCALIFQVYDAADSGAHSFCGKFAFAFAAKYTRPISSNPALM